MQAQQEYFPVSKNPFSFKPGLRRLPDTAQQSGDFCFQIDSKWPDYHRQKRLARHESLSKYICQSELSDTTRRAVCRFFVDTLCQEHPDLFRLERNGGALYLHCQLSGQVLAFDSQFELTSRPRNLDLPYLDGLDALCCQIQEDCSIVQLRDENDYLAYLHLCFPNYWAPQEKIGQDFFTAHQLVPAMEKINARRKELNRMLSQAGAYERFTWGLTSDTRLNHHPEPPPGADPVVWQGKQFAAPDSRLYLRVERQVTAGLPDCQAYVFLIRTYLYDIERFQQEQLQRLARSIESMGDNLLRYKGLYRHKDEIVRRINKLKS